MIVRDVLCLYDTLSNSKLPGQRVSFVWYMDDERHNGTVIAACEDDTVDVLIDEGMCC